MTEIHEMDKDCPKEKNFISAVVYLHNDENNAVTFFESLNRALSELFDNYEFIVVDDACSDETIKRIREWAGEIDKPFTILHMSLYHGVEDAMNAGIDAAIGDFIYEFDSIQLPYNTALIADAYRQSIAGNDIVGVCPENVRIGSKLFYKVFNANSGSVYKLHTDAFRLVSRRAINRIHASHSYMPYRKAAYASSGLKVGVISFPGKIHNNQKSKFSLAVDSLVLYTNAGYRISICLTLFMLLVSVAELIYTVVTYCIGKPLAGWTTTMLVISFGFLGLFFILSIMIKYLSLTLDMSFRKQKYLIEGIEKIQK